MSEGILRCINRISPHACEYVKGAMEQGNVQIIHEDFHEDGEGVFLLAKGEKYHIFYASFYECSVDERLMEKMREITLEHINNTEKTVCFNVYGENHSIIEAVREMGFRCDMYGYHMEHSEEKIVDSSEMNLHIRDFKENMIDEIATLMDGAYYQMNKDNGWNTKHHQENKESILEDLLELDEDDGLKIFFFEDTMIGACFCVGDYIGDLFVHPEFQGRGFGSMIIAHCINHMREVRGSKNVRLRVLKTNTGAKKLYKKLGFRDIAYFAEHTYKK